LSIWTSAVSVAVAVAVSSSGISTAAPDEPATESAAEADPPAASATGSADDPSEDPTEDPIEDPTEDPSNPFKDALVEEAHDRFLDGNERFRDRRYLEAAADYERSFAAVPNGYVLYNLGLAYEKAGDYVRALDANLRYVALPDCIGEEYLCAANREEVEETITKLRSKVGTLSVMIDEGVEVRGFEIDDRFLPPEDFPLVLAPGHYELRVRGIHRNEVRTRDIDIVPGQITSMVIGPFNAPEPTFNDIGVRDSGGDGVAAPTGRLSEEERRRRLRIAFYGGVGVTAAAGIATGVVGGLALQAHNEFESRCRGQGVDCTGSTYPQNAFDRVQELRPVTNALIGVTAGLGITTVVLGLFAFSGRQGPGARASVTRVQPSPGGVRVRF
jgi:hypothetical protein